MPQGVAQIREHLSVTVARVEIVAHDPNQQELSANVGFGQLATMPNLVDENAQPAPEGRRSLIV